MGTFMTNARIGTENWEYEIIWKKLPARKIPITFNLNIEILI